VAEDQAHEKNVDDVRQPAEDERRGDDSEKRDPGRRVDLVIATAGVAGTLVAAASLAYQVLHG